MKNASFRLLLLWSLFIAIFIGALIGLVDFAAHHITVPTKKSVPVPPPTTPSPTRKVPKPSEAPQPKANWEKFQSEFGDELDGNFSDTGILLSVQGKVNRNNPAPSNFRTDNEQEVRARAKEILDSAKSLLGVENRAPLILSKTRLGPYSAQVFYSETNNGIPIAPMGEVKIDLGPHGELLGLYSSYVSEIPFHTEFQLSPSEARSRALANRPQAGQAIGGRRIIWVASGEGRAAYEYSIRGHEIVIDAKTGEILSEENSRQY